MLEIDKKVFVFTNKEIWFAECPHDVEGCDSVSFMQSKRKIDLAGFTCYDFPTLVLDLTQDLDALWGNIRKSFRNEINRAQREGIKVNINENFDEFYEITKSFRRKKGLAGKGVDPEFMKRYGTLFTAELNHEILFGIFWLEDDSNIRGLITASKRLDAVREKAVMIGYANRLMWWESIKYAKAKGIKEFDFGGYYTGENKNDPRNNINVFKEGFGGQLVTHYNYYKIYSRIYKWARSIYWGLRPNRNS